MYGSIHAEKFAIYVFSNYINTMPCGANVLYSLCYFGYPHF